MSTININPSRKEHRNIFSGTVVPVFTEGNEMNIALHTNMGTEVPIAKNHLEKRLRQLIWCDVRLSGRIVPSSDRHNTQGELEVARYWYNGPFYDDSWTEDDHYQYSKYFKRDFFDRRRGSSDYDVA